MGASCSKGIGCRLQKAITYSLKPRWLHPTSNSQLVCSAVGFAISRNDAECSVRIVTGSHHQLLSDESKQLFLNSPFVVSAASDRMYRLTGAALTLNQSVEMQSEGTTVGTIQLPPDGHPIVLMSDSAPTGGYPRIAHVISADLQSWLSFGQARKFDSASSL